MSDKLLEIRDLKKHFPVMKGLIFQKPDWSREGGGWRLVLDWGWRDGRPGGRVRMRQNHHHEDDPHAGKPNGRVDSLSG